MMGLDKSQLHAKIEVAGFICYENTKEFVFKNWDKLKWKNHLFLGETDFTIGFAAPMFPTQIYLSLTNHPGQLSLAILSWVSTMSTGQRAVMLCYWDRVKADMVLFAGTTV